MTDLPDIEACKHLLLERREALVQAQAQGQGAQQIVELDQTCTGRLSRMDALQGQAMAQATSGRRQMELRRIDAALIRLEQGEYGECLSCGEMISPGRLGIDPAATLCLACAEQAEQN
ncbi:MAG TPA: TraR/DksA C4-type zinc finger protein [Thioalkalivibrio sp.]|nr:TraR/DksA C4-type zinc finger protein [Thioalkalivibrio sp.]